MRVLTPESADEDDRDNDEQQKSKRGFDRDCDRVIEPLTGRIEVSKKIERAGVVENVGETRDVRLRQNVKSL